MREIAILMAAGLGMRMRPLTETVPKPLIKVFNKPMIETVIEGLLQRSVDEIYVVTGYLEKQFLYLCQKYSKVKLIHNPDYEGKNNISSIYSARDILLKGDCFICETDIYVADASIFQRKLSRSCYYGMMRSGHTDDWVFDLEDGKIIRIGQGGDDTYNMVGIAFFKSEDALILKEKIEAAYTDSTSAGLFWDDIVNRNLGLIDLIVEPVKIGQLIEIDTVEELKEFDGSAYSITTNRKYRN